MELTEIVSDLRAETAALDSILSALGEGDWLTPTPADGWDIRDTIAHLADTDDIAYDHLTDGPRDLLTEAIEAGGVSDEFTRRQVLKGRRMTPQDVHDWWTKSSDKVANALDKQDPDTRVKWGPNHIRPASFASARLMETWAHALDCAAAVGAQPKDTDRLAHVAQLGVRALPYALSVQNPAQTISGPLRVRLELPSGTVFELGPDDAPNVISGTASDFCRVFTQRARNNEANNLTTSGPDIKTILASARTYL